MRTRTTGRAGQQQARSPRSCSPDQAAWSSGCIPAAWPAADRPTLPALRRGNLIPIQPASRPASRPGRGLTPVQDGTFGPDHPGRPPWHRGPNAPADSDHRLQTTMTQAKNHTAADSGGGIEIVRMPAVLDLTTSEGVAALGCAAIARLARLVLPGLTGLSFCDARGLSPSSGSPTRPTRPGAVSASSRRGRRSRRSCGSAAWTAGYRCSPPPTTRWRSAPPQPAFRQPERADRPEGTQQAHRAGRPGAHHHAVCSDGPGGRSPGCERARGADHQRLPRPVEATDKAGNGGTDKAAQATPVSRLPQRPFSVREGRAGCRLPLLPLAQREQLLPTLRPQPGQPDWHGGLYPAIHVNAGIRRTRMHSETPCPGSARCAPSRPMPPDEGMPPP